MNNGRIGRFLCLVVYQCVIALSSIECGSEKKDRDGVFHLQAIARS